MEKFNNLVGIPFLKGGSSKVGADCWGIVLLAFQLEGIAISDNIGCKADGLGLALIIQREKNNPSKWQKIIRPQKAAVAICYERGSPRPTHVGFCVSDSHMLHSMQQDSEIQTISHLSRVFKKIEYYKYVGQK